MTTDTAAKPGFLSQFFAAPPRLAALLPDGRFFVRLVPVDPEGDEASTAEQVNLALETLAPFPIAQLYHGHYWQPGSPRALVYAVYRKRFPAEETAAWGEAEIVVPAFVSLLTDPAPAGSTRVLTSPDAVTVFHWGDDTFVPTQAIVHPFAPDTDDAGRTTARDQVLRSLGADPGTVEDWDYPVLHRVSDNGEVTFLSGERPLVIPADLAAALDVRDADEIAYRRGIQRRDIWLWRGCAALVTLVLLCTVAEGALFYGKSQQQKAANLILNDKQEVATLTATEQSTLRAEQIFKRRLPVLELVNFVAQAGRRAGSFQFTRVIAQLTKDNLPQLTLTANTGSLQESNNLLTALKNLPECKTVEFTTQPSMGGNRGGPGATTADPNATATYQFVMRVVFNADAIRPENAKAPAATASIP